jgi:hypothetical protein
MAFLIRLRNRRTGERFTSRCFESFEAAARYGDRLDGAEWTWSIDEA